MTPHGGFSGAGAKAPWLPLAADYGTVNVAYELQDDRSFLSLFRKLLDCRKKTPALTIGTYRSINLAQAGAWKACFVYERQAGDQRLLIALNFSDEEQPLGLPFSASATIVVSTGLDRAGSVNLADFGLRANEGCILALAG